MGSFTPKQLRASLVLPAGVFPGTQSNTLVLSGYRMSAKLTGAANFTNQLTLDIYGMRQADMAAATVIYGRSGRVTEINARTLIVLESNDGSGWLQVFEGQAQQAYPDYRALPDVALHIEAWTGAGMQWLPAQPSSFQGAVDAASLAGQLASKMGFSFENNGVTATLHSPYLAGTLMDQFKRLAEAAAFDWYFDAKSTLIICPKTQGRQGKRAVVLSPTSGLVGYPSFNQYGVQVTCLFTPAIELGSPIQLDTGGAVPGVDGLWFPYHAVHELESVKPSGAWFSHLDCADFPQAAS